MILVTYDLAHDSSHDMVLMQPMTIMILTDEERDFADQGPLTDMDMEEDAEMLALMLKHMPSCIDAADIEQLVRDIPVQPPPVVPVRTKDDQRIGIIGYASADTQRDRGNGSRLY